MHPAIAARLAFASIRRLATGRWGATRGSSCDARQLEIIYARLADARMPIDRWLPQPRLLTMDADGSGWANDGVHLAYLGPNPSFYVQGGHSHDLENPDGLGELRKEIDERNASSPAKLVQLTGVRSMPLVTLRDLVARLDPATEIRLMVEQLQLPSTDGVAPWALALYDEVLREPDRKARLVEAGNRASGSRCGALLGEGLSKAEPDAKVLRRVLIDALVACDCEGVDVMTTAWFFEITFLPHHTKAWLRLRVDPNGLPVDAAGDLGGLVEALDRLAPAERAKGVWFSPPAPERARS